MWWKNLLKGILKRPWIIAIVIMTLVMGGMYMKIANLKGEVSDLKVKVEQVESDYRTCKTNEVTYEEAIEACQDETIKFKDRNEILVGQIEKEKDRVEYWRDKYNNKVCFQPEDEKCVGENERGVLNDESNVEAVDRINDLFESK